MKHTVNKSEDHCFSVRKCNARQTHNHKKLKLTLNPLALKQLFYKFAYCVLDLRAFRAHARVQFLEWPG